MGRKRKRPTKVLSGRIDARDYLKAKACANQTGMSIIQAYQKLLREGKI